MLTLLQNIPTLYHLARSDHCTPTVANCSNYCGSWCWCRNCSYFTKQTTRGGNPTRVFYPVGYGHSFGNCGISDLLSAAGSTQASIQRNDRELLSAPGASWLWWFWVSVMPFDL